MSSAVERESAPKRPRPGIRVGPPARAVPAASVPNNLRRHTTASGAAPSPLPLRLPPAHRPGPGTSAERPAMSMDAPSTPAAAGLAALDLPARATAGRAAVPGRFHRLAVERHRQRRLPSRPFPCNPAGAGSGCSSAPDRAASRGADAEGRSGAAEAPAIGIPSQTCTGRHPMPPPAPRHEGVPSFPAQAASAR